MEWVGHAACMIAMRNAYKSLIGIPEGRTKLERIILEWILVKLGGVMWTGCF
jgi:hypothetical protein